MENNEVTTFDKRDKLKHYLIGLAISTGVTIVLVGALIGLMVVADEIYSNIVKYGYKESGGDVFTRLFYNKDKQEFVMTIIDKAPAFNQLDINNAPIEGDVSDRPVGGLGILIVKKIMTEYAYDRINNKNILVLKKKF